MISYLAVLVLGIITGAFLDHHFSSKIEAVAQRFEAAAKTLKG